MAGKGGTALVTCVVVAVLAGVASVARSHWLPGVQPLAAQTESNVAASGISAQVAQPDEETETFQIPSGADRDLVADHKFLQELNEKWRLMTDAYRVFIEGWNAYARDLGIFVGRPGFLKVSLDRLNSTHASFTKRVKQFAALLYHEDEPLGASQKQVPPDPALLKIDEVVNQTFMNQEVPLDGRAYFACTFENCAFVYNFGPTGGFTDCAFKGSRGLKGGDPRLQHLLRFLGSLGLLNPWTKPLYIPKQSSLISEGSIEDEADRAIDIIMGDKAHPYWHEEHPQHKQAVEYVQKLHQIAKRWEKKNV
jgi:hypothetical protein